MKMEHLVMGFNYFGDTIFGGMSYVLAIFGAKEPGYQDINCSTSMKND
jgi:hypothetical protein